MDIKEVNSSNIQECTKLFMNVFNAEPWNDKWTIESASELFHEYIKTPGFIGYASFINNKIVAVCLGYKRTWWDGNSFFIEEFFVDCEKQNSGLGTCFLEKIEKYLTKNHISNIALLTLSKSIAEKFYLKNGYGNLDFMTFMRKNI